MRTARAKRTQKTQIFRILPHRAPVRHFQKTTTRPIPAAIVLGTAVVATALPLPSSTPATATGTAHVTRAYTDKSTHEPGKQATITAETSTGGNVHFSVSPDDGGRPTPLDFTTGTDEQGRMTLTFNVVQQQEMLQILMDAKPAGVEPILHSDMGWQYQHETYIGTLADNGFIQSMSRKGNCIDNGATEQVFGHLKDEFFRGQDWQTFESFKAYLATYITHWNTTRRQVKLKGLTPAEYRNQALQEAA